MFEISRDRKCLQEIGRTCYVRYLTYKSHKMSLRYIKDLQRNKIVSMSKEITEFISIIIKI